MVCKCAGFNFDSRNLAEVGRLLQHAHEDPEILNRSGLLLAAGLEQEPSLLPFLMLSHALPGAPRNVAAGRGYQAIFPCNTKLSPAAFENEGFNKAGIAVCRVHSSSAHTTSS